MKNFILMLLVIALFLFLSATAQAQHMLILPQYTFVKSSLDTTETQPVLILYFQAIDGTEVRAFGFIYPSGIYLGEVLILPNGKTQGYPFQYEEIKPDTTKGKELKYDLGRVFKD